MMRTVSTSQKETIGCPLAAKGGYLVSTKPMWHEAYNQFDSINEGSGG